MVFNHAVKTSILSDTLKEVIQKSFLSIMTDEINKLENEMLQKINKITKEAKDQAKKEANKMTIELLQKADLQGFSVELKL